MRLLHRDHATGAICLTADLHSNIPPYAILSHRWGSDEVTFQELHDGTGLSKHGYDKIRFCGEQAQRDGLSHFWVDTCCIDKKNAVELQTAITSMFRWYQNAKRCYVYLDDVSYPASQSTGHLEEPPAKKRKHMDTTVPTEPLCHSAFRKSLWFTRGWTLQELLAPTSVDFFSREHTLLGNKSSLEGVIWDITHIPVEALRNCPLSDFRVSDRFSWMEDRETTVEEDKAYAMLGIFSVQIPLIYGEGSENAFRRLRSEVSQATKPPPIPVAEGAAFDSRAEEHSARCYPETWVELLSKIASWAVDPDGKPIFWLNGVAGTGKSTISRTVAQRFHERGLLGATFFFKRGEAERGHAGRLFTTLAAQFAAKIPRVAQQIQTALDNDPNVCSKALSEQFKQLILNTLTYARGPQTLVIVIDALDECDKDVDIRVIIHLLSQVSALPHVRLRTLLTSRPELPIRLGFRKVQGGYQDLVLHEMPQEVVTHDLRVFFEIELTRIYEEYNDSSFEDVQLPPDWPSLHIDTLVRRAYPLFIIAATMCRFLEPAQFNPDDQLQKLLHYHATGHTSDQLKDTYLPVLNQLISEQTNVNKQLLLEGFRDIVGTIVLLAEPLSARALSGILQIPLPIIQNQLKLLHSVLAVPSTSDGPIRTFHLSFRDFLLGPSRQDTHEFWIDEQFAHKKLAARCIQLLSTGEILKKDICNLCTPGVSLSQVDRQTINKSLPSEVQYACRYWVCHLEFSGTAVQDDDQVYAFLQTHFLHWLEALCLMGSIHSSLSMLQTLRDRCQRGTCIDSFLHDADRFIRNCIHIIALHPLQLYCSGICFAPQKSVIRQEFQKEMSAWIVKPPYMPDTWGACTQTFEGHSGWIFSIAISSDGRWLASGSEDCTIKVWDVTMGACTQTFEGHSGWIFSIAISSDGRWLASGSEDCTIKIWDVTMGACTQTLEGHNKTVHSIAISPDGNWIVSGSSDCTIKIWDLATGACKKTLKDHRDEIHSISLSTDGCWLASGGWDTAIKIWNVVTGACKTTMIANESVRSIAMSPDSHWLASITGYNTVQIWDLATGTCKKTVKGNGPVRSLAISPDSSWIALSVPEAIEIWDVTTSTCIQAYASLLNEVTGVSITHACVAISPDCRWFASGSGTVEIWDLSISTSRNEPQKDDDISMTLSPNGCWLVIQLGDQTVKIWDVAAGVYLHAPEGQHALMAISPDSRWLALGQYDGVTMTVGIWEILTGTYIQTFQTDEDPMVIAISPNNRWLALVFDIGDIGIWDLTKGTFRLTLDAHNSWDFLTDLGGSIAIAPDSTWLASVSGDRRVADIWDTETGIIKHRLKGPSDRTRILSMVISPDSCWLVVGFYGRDIGIWDLKLGNWKQWFKGPEYCETYTVSISPSGSRLVIVSGYGSLHIWNIATGICARALTLGHNMEMRGYLIRVAFYSNTSLRTAIGDINLDPATHLTTLKSHRPETLPFEIDKPSPCYKGYGIDAGLTWITWNGLKVMWLPPKYRPRTPNLTAPPQSAISGTTIAIRCALNNVIVFQLSTNNSIV
ncbi:vegetative incompatibility protein HET-E-1 [Xylaria grammica]|nr:vegetative incompatibility protein HET-E-1 [Xylaria grammica]